MEWVETSLGRVPIWGAFNSARPLVLGIRGAFGLVDQLADLDPPGCDLALLHLPGMHSPPLVSLSIGAFIAAFDQVIRSRFTGREITCVGASLGAVVALGLKTPEIKGVLAVEPFFSTAKLWPLIEYLRIMHPQNDAFGLEWAAKVLGYGRPVEDRDFSSVLGRCDRPALALVGDIPLQPPRRTLGMPSLTDEEDRSRLTCEIYSGGHDAPMSTIRQSLTNMMMMRPTPP